MGALDGMMPGVPGPVMRPTAAPSQAGPLLTGQMAGLPPQLLQMLAARLLGGAAPAPGGGALNAPGAPPPGQPPGPPGQPGVPGALNAGAADAMGAAAGQMPQPDFMAALQRIQALKSSTNMDPQSSEFDEATKRLVARGVVPQGQVDRVRMSPARRPSILPDTKLSDLTRDGTEF